LTNLRLYLADILYFRTDPFVFKTAEFCKRNFRKVTSTMSHIGLELKKIGQGFGRLRRDIGYVLGASYKTTQYKYQQDKPLEKAKIRQIRGDVIRFVPFSFFILIPGAEFLLPPFLVVFPNSIPSQFQSEETRAQKFQAINKRRHKAAINLNQSLPLYLKHLEQDEGVYE